MFFDATNLIFSSLRVIFWDGNAEFVAKVARDKIGVK